MIDSNTVTLGALALIPLVVLAYRSLVKISYEKQIEGGTEKLTMEFIPPHFHSSVQPPEISQSHTEKVIHEPIEVNDSPISLPQPSSSMPLIEPKPLKFWQKLPKFLQLRN
jgi:hypothetical protein